MKTLVMNSIKISALVLFLIALLILNACSGTQQNSNEDNDRLSAGEQKPKPPDTDIHTASFMGNIQAVKQHINAGTDLNKKDQYGSTPLIIATTFGKTEVALALIEAGANVNLTNNDGSTPLHTAAFFCRVEIVKTLLENDADKTIKNSFGSTPLQSVEGPFDEVKPFYDQIGKDLGPLGLRLDYDYLKNTRPVIADMLR